jgi:hypothetical protein
MGHSFSPSLETLAIIAESQPSMAESRATKIEDGAPPSSIFRAVQAKRLEISD